MSVKVKGLALLLSAYLLLLCMHAPAQLLRRALPPEVSVGGFSGSLWRGGLQQLSWRSVSLAELRWRVTFSSLLPALQIELRDPQGIRGQGIVRGWRSLQLHEWQLSLPAGYVVQQLPLAVPIAAQGRLLLRLPQGEITRSGCASLSGVLSWQDARLSSPLGELALATPQLQLSCDGSGFGMVLRQDSPQLRLSGRGSVEINGGYRFSGQLRGGDALPESLRPLIGALGKANAQGDVAWQLQGRVR